MNNIILSPTSIKYFDSSSVESAGVFVAKILNSRLHVDKNCILLTECIEQAQKLHKTKDLINGCLSIFMVDKQRIKLSEVQIKKRNILSEFRKLDSEFSVADNRCNSIVIDDIPQIHLLPYLQHQHRNKLQDVEEFIGNLFLEKRFELNPGDEFDFTKELIVPYLKDSKNLVVGDRYLDSISSQMLLDKIINSLTTSCSITIKTIGTTETEKYLTNAQTKFTKHTIVSHLFSKDFQDTSKEYKSKLHSRWIETENVRIDLGDSLDFTYRDRNDSSIKVKTQNIISVFRKLKR